MAIELRKPPEERTWHGQHRRSDPLRPPSADPADLAPRLRRLVRSDAVESGFVQTLRLDLKPLPLAAYRLLLDGQRAEAEALIGFALEGSRLSGLAPILRYRADQLDRDPSELPWLVHLMVWREQWVVVGDIGFHAPPDDKGCVEIGYTVIEHYRRHGFASEAALGLARWAGGQPGVKTLRASISPQNTPSLRLAGRLGLVQVGSQIDEIDGEELVFEGAIP